MLNFSVTITFYSNMVTYCYYGSLSRIVNKKQFNFPNYFAYSNNDGTLSNIYNH